MIDSGRLIPGGRYFYIVTGSKVRTVGMVEYQRADARFGLHHHALG